MAQLVGVGTDIPAREKVINEPIVSCVFVVFPSEYDRSLAHLGFGATFSIKSMFKMS